MHLNSPRKAVGDIIPVLLATTIAIPVSKKGSEKSMACARSKLIFNDVITRSALWLIRAATRPFQRPFCERKPHNISCARHAMHPAILKGCITSKVHRCQPSLAFQGCSEPNLTHNSPKYLE